MKIMKKSLLLIWLCSTFLSSDLSSVFAESNLPQKLAQAYQMNNELIYEKAPLDAHESISLLTTNYIKQLKYVKQLSDEKLERELNRQNLDFIRDKTLLQKHILNLYEYEGGGSQIYKPNIYERVSTGEAERGEGRQHVAILIHRIITIFNGMSKNPELARELYGIMPKEALNEWYFEALENKRKLFSSNREFKCVQIRLMEKGGGGDTEVCYVFGRLVEGEIEKSMAMRMVIEKGDFGFFVSEVAQTMDPVLVKRLEKVLSPKFELSH